MEFKSVHARFMLILLPLFILSFAAISGITYFMARTMLEADAVQLAQSIGGEAALKFQLSVSNIHAPLRMAATSSAVRSGDEEQILSILRRLKDASPLIARTFYVRPDGRTLRMDGKYLDRSSREYFRHVVETKEPYISKAFVGETTQTMLTMVLHPVVTDGRLDGILMASIHLRELAWNIFSEWRQGKCYVYITDNEGLIVGCNEHSEYVGMVNLISKRMPSSHAEPRPRLRHRPTAGGERTQARPAAIDPRLSEAVKQALESGEKTSAAFMSIDGEERFAIITPLELAGNRWAVLSAFPMEQVTAPIGQLLEVTTVVFCMIFAAASGAILLFAQSISAPLENIAREMSRIDTEGVGASTEADELGVLAEGVARMRGLRDEKAHFEQKASMDELTGLLNRFGFNRQMSEAVAENEGRKAALVFADLDHLKHINDRLGHAAGDEALVTAAEILREGFGGEAVVGRVGGDEFAAFLCAEGDSYEARLRRVRDTASRRNAEDGKPYYVEFSLGMTEFVCAPEVDLSALMERADACLYDSKSRRRPTSVREDAPIP